ncbi:MAG: 2-C-methyl-D-erythritol 4-phosphate cytidylyltransferase [Desulfomicrobiaceae bacterium]|nr:2-C-methyl-D-erythritol 4-phosphate cytidylyltransferase [Desulfomicrobiaceae bacterium]
MPSGRLLEAAGNRRPREMTATRVGGHRIRLIVRLRFFGVSTMQLWCILLAAGQGSRLAPATGGVAKQFLSVGGEPLYLSSARTLAAVPEMRGMVVVLPREDFSSHAAQLETLLAEQPLGIEVRTAPGGARRQDSVAHGLAQVPASATHVLVHDAARPFVSAQLTTRLLDAWTGDCGGVIPGLAPTDTIKECQGDRVVRTLDRRRLMAVQTPQLFTAAVLRRAHQWAHDHAVEVTDDASLVEAMGECVRVVPGEADNHKITHPEDLAMLTPPRPNRRHTIGFGYDVHAYGGDRPMVLGGMPIPGAPAVRAHSDGDVLLHALADAILGCLGAGDIGEHFPDTDPRWEAIPSSVLLDQILERGRQQDLVIDHVDLTIIAQIPRLAPHREAIRANVARLLELSPHQVNLKATTEEGLGFTGRKEGIKAVAVVTGSMPC